MDNAQKTQVVVAALEAEDSSPPVTRTQDFWVAKVKRVLQTNDAASRLANCDQLRLYSDQVVKGTTLIQSIPRRPSVALAPCLLCFKVPTEHAYVRHVKRG